MNGLLLIKNIDLLPSGTLETLYMTVVSTLFAYIIGLPIGILLFVTGKNGIAQNRTVNLILGFIVNLFRSIPFLILLVALIPFTRLIVGGFIGSTAAIVPLVVASAPFVARLVESSLAEVDGGLIEAASAMGASVPRIVFRVLIPEAKPSLITNAAIAITTILSYSAMAGFVAGGGLGDIAMQYGFYQNNNELMWITVLLLFLIVQLFQMGGTFLAKILDKRIRARKKINKKKRKEILS